MTWQDEWDQDQPQRDRLADRLVVGMCVVLWTFLAFVIVALVAAWA